MFSPFRHGAGLAAYVKKTKVDLVHFPLISPHYLPYLWGVTWLSRNDRPAIAISQVDVNLSYKYRDFGARSGAEQHKSVWLHRIYFHTVKLAGIFSWYQAFEDLDRQLHIKGRPLTRAARYCFVDTERFQPAAEKERMIVFAARMAPIKRPLLFVESIKEAAKGSPAVFDGWKIVMYGDGPLMKKVRDYVRQENLAGLVSVPGGVDLRCELAKSEIFVSTQDLENFSSISMLEAMACGNAIIAFDVGQTRMFLRDGENGFAVRGDTPGAMAQAIIRMVSEPELRKTFGRRSRAISLEEHCADNFVTDITTFWRDVMARSRTGGQ